MNNCSATICKSKYYKRDPFWISIKDGLIKLIQFETAININAPEKFKIILQSEDNTTEYYIDPNLNDNINKYDSHDIDIIFNASSTKISIVPLPKNEEIYNANQILSYSINYIVLPNDNDYKGKRNPTPKPVLKQLVAID